MWRLGVIWRMKKEEGLKPIIQPAHHLRQPLIKIVLSFGEVHWSDESHLRRAPRRHHMQGDLRFLFLRLQSGRIRSDLRKNWARVEHHPINRIALKQLIKRSLLV